jgi:hypothetical protein
MITLEQRLGPRSSERAYRVEHCDRCGIRLAREPLYVVAEDLLCPWCHHQWRKLFAGEDEDGRLRHGPGTRFRP